MTVDQIKELIQVVNDSGIAELEVQRGEDRVRIRRAFGPMMQEYAVGAGSAQSLGAGQPAQPVTLQAASAALPPVSAPPTPEETKRVYVKSPIVGTFYEAGSPGTPAFVKVGDQVAPGQVLCIIESMKLMNEIECEVSGVIVAKLVENGRPVEYGEALFAVQPS